MKKKTILTIVLALLVAAGIYTCFRLAKRGTDITGVTTLPDRNTVIMNAKTGDEFAAGTGYLTVAEGEHIHLEYDLSAGSIDVSFKPGEDALFGTLMSQDEPLTSEDLEDLPTAEDMTGEGVFGQEDVTGKGSMDFDVAADTYTVYIVNNNAIGSATFTTKK